MTWIRPSTTTATFFVALVAAAVLRVCTLGYDLPFIYHPDEPVNVDITQQVFKSRDLNPHFFVYPSLLYYVNDAAYCAFYAVGRVTGTLKTRDDIAPLQKLAMGVTKAPQPNLILVSRAITVAFGFGTVALTWLLGMRLLGDRRAAAVASLLVAVGPTNVELSRYITPDTLMTFFAVAAVWAASRVALIGRPADSVLAGLLVGLTASTKYNGVFVLLPVIYAHLRVANGAQSRWSFLVFSCLCAAAGFFAATPYALLDPYTFVDYLKFVRDQYATGHAGMEGNTVPWYLSYMGKTGGLVYLLALIEIIRGVVARSKPIILLSIFPVAYFIFIAGFEIRNDRTFLPMTPFLFLLAGSGLSNGFRAALRIRRSHLRRASVAAVVAVTILGTAQPAIGSVRDAIQRSQDDSRKTARIWIAENLPPGSRIAIEPYAPFIDPQRFTIQAFTSAIAHDASWYVANGFQYVIVSQGMYGRFFLEPGHYPAQVASYNKLFRDLPPMRVFNDGRYEVRILGTDREGTLGR
jgi:4-amino-4-deoxy-L-arabinose transferase-like glycosyltransferase